VIVRRVRVAAEEVSGDARSRRRRTVPKGQMELLQRGRVGYVFSYSFRLTDKLGDAAEIEGWTASAPIGPCWTPSKRHIPTSPVP
jgi:hypothetical protein